MRCLLILCCGFLLASAVNLPGVPVDFDLDDKVLSAIVDDVAERLEEEYMTFLKTGVETPAFKQLTTQLAKAHTKKDIFTKNMDDLEKRDSFVVCTLCRSVINIMMRTVREEDGELNGENSEAIMKNIAYDVCRRLNLQTEEVCKGVIDAEFPTVHYIMKNSAMDSHSFCSLFMGNSFCSPGKHPAYNWSLKVDTNSEPITGPKSDTPRASDSDLRICQFTDIHHDPMYQEGSLAACDEPMCCQRKKSEVEGKPEAAGYWGDYRDCDLPWRSFESALDHAAKNAKCDIIYQTGDVIDHMVWATSVKKNTEVLSKVSNEFTKVFPKVPVYPCIGNHEPHPLNNFSPEDVPTEINTRWLYESLYNDWKGSLPESTKETILKGGYYTVVPRKGFRVISLNSNDCYTDNFWLYHNGTDKIPQLQWFHDTLLAAEKAKEKVHVLSHIPSGDGTCWNVWSREFNRCITRFHKTISGIFNGHSHKDDITLHYSEQGYATAIAWNGGALTTYSYKNPNYRVYNVDSETLDVTNHETYIYDLNEANKHPDQPPKWYLEYEFIKEFTEDTSPAGIDKLLDEFAAKPSYLRKFWRFKVTTAEPQVTRGCDRGCLAGTLCRMAVTVNDQTSRCEELKERLFKALDEEKDEEEEDEDDGAATLSVLSFSALIALVVSMRIGF